MNEEIIYTCTSCNNLLVKKEKKLHCENCNTQWPIIDGIPQFVSEYHYWGEITQNVMHQINEQIKTNYWKDVLKENLKAQKLNGTYEFILNLDRANWHLFLPIPRDGRVLDIGSGLGTISQALSYDYRKIVAIETVPERLYFSRIRFKQENINNIQLVQANLMDLPFPDNYFDLVVLNGVLEWVGLTDKNKNPRELQLKALKNIHRVLKPNGYLYIGIENRYGYNFFFGRIDHSYLKYTSLLPRKLANIYSYLKKKESYRTYTYTSAGYAKLLSQSGFQNTSFYCPIVGYNQPNIIFELKKNPINYYIKQFIFSKNFKKRIIRLVVKTLSNFDLFKYIVGDYIVFTQKEKSSTENRIINYVNNNQVKLNLSKEQLKNLSLFAYNYSSAISFILLNKKQPLFHIKLRRAVDVDNTLKQEYENLKTINNKIDKSLKSFIPGLAILDKVDEFQILVQNVLPGIRFDGFLRSFNYKGSEKEKQLLFNKLELIKNFLIKFHRSVQNEHCYFKNEELELKVKNLFQQYFNNINKDNEIDNIIKQAKSLNEISIPQIPQHGDFCGSNILVNKNDFYVIDWESYALTDLPLFDSFHILTTSIFSFFHDQDINTFKRIYFKDSEFTSFIKYFLEDYCEKLNISKKLINLCFPLYLVTFYKLFHTNPVREKIVKSYCQYIQYYFEHQDKLIFNQ